MSPGSSFLMEIVSVISDRVASTKDVELDMTCQMDKLTMKQLQPTFRIFPLISNPTCEKVLLCETHNLGVLIGVF